MYNAQEILNQHIDADLSSIEILITSSNQKDIMPLYRDYHKMGFTPMVEERNGQHFLVADISSKRKNNVIDISIKRSQKSQVIEVNFESKKVVSRT